MRIKDQARKREDNRRHSGGVVRQDDGPGRLPWRVARQGARTDMEKLPPGLAAGLPAKDKNLARISHQGVALFSRVQLGAGFSASGRARDRRA